LATPAFCFPGAGVHTPGKMQSHMHQQLSPVRLLRDPHNSVGVAFRLRPLGMQVLDKAGTGHDDF